MSDNVHTNINTFKFYSLRDINEYQLQLYVKYTHTCIYIYIYIYIHITIRHQNISNIF